MWQGMRTLIATQGPRTRRRYGLPSYATSPFNALRWSVYLMRQFALAGVPVRPWVAYRSWPGAGGPGDPPVGCVRRTA